MQGRLFSRALEDKSLQNCFLSGIIGVSCEALY